MVITFCLVVIALILLVSVVEVIKQEKEEKEKQARLREEERRRKQAYQDRYGCSLEEMRERVKQSPNIKKIADQIREKLHYEIEFEVCDDGLYDRRFSKIFEFSSIGVSRIPDGCISVFCDGLVKELQSFAPYKLNIEHSVYEGVHEYRYIIEKESPKIIFGSDW